jgi:hypothetical protein
MESSRFDDVTRMFGSSRSRRSLGASGIAALVALLAGGSAETALAKKKKRSRKKKKAQDTAPPPAPAPLCAPNCGDRRCGGDGCGGSCGTCGGGESCQDGRCVCVPACGGKTCGPDGCGESCGTCHAAETCQESQCVCSGGAPGPGEVCTDTASCCAYTELDERSCERGSGPCSTILKACRYGLGGPCGGSCDCLGDLVCTDGVCRCPRGRDYAGGGACCGDGLVRCPGTRCCSLGNCICFPIDGCRCADPFP